MPELNPSEIQLLVTGASGFIGTHFVDQSKIDNIDTLSVKNQHWMDTDFSVYSTILHLAGIVHVSNAPDDHYFAVNTDLSIAIAKKAQQAGCRHFIYMSSCSVFDSRRDSVFEENSLCEPVGAYGQSKLKAEQALLELNSENFIVSIVRPPLVYGENSKANMAALINLVNKSLPLPFKNMNNQRSFVYIKNVVAFLDALIYQQKSGLFHVCDKNPVSTEQLVTFIADSLQIRLKLFRLPSILKTLFKSLKPALYLKLFGSFQLSCEKSYQALHFEPGYSTQEGLLDMFGQLSKEQ